MARYSINQEQENLYQRIWIFDIREKSVQHI